MLRVALERQPDIFANQVRYPARLSQRELRDTECNIDPGFAPDRGG